MALFSDGTIVLWYVDDVQYDDNNDIIEEGMYYYYCDKIVDEMGITDKY